MVITVFNNVYAVLCLLQCILMVISGAIFFHNCPGSVILGIYLILQGLIGIIIPTLMCCVFSCGCRITRVTYYTACVVAGLICTGWVIAGSHWVNVSECKSSTLHKIALGFLPAYWLSNGLYLLLTVIYRNCCKDQTPNADN